MRKTAASLQNCSLPLITASEGNCPTKYECQTWATGQLISQYTSLLLWHLFREAAPRATGQGGTKPRGV